MAGPAAAGQSLPPFTEALLPMGSNLYAVSIGPGGPGEEFGSDAANGGFYRIVPGGTAEEIELSDGQGLRNPTGLVQAGNQIFIVDGNQVISTAPDGLVNWRQSLDDEGVFFYDVEALDDNTLIVSDFGWGVFVSAEVQTGAIQPYLGDLRINGLARFAIADKGIYAVSWGSDDAWDSALYLVAQSQGSNTADLIADGFGNLESVGLINGNIVVGGYRGHEKFPEARLLSISPEGTVLSLSTGSHSQGVSDIFFDGTSIWLTYFYDAFYKKLSSQTLQKTE
ncbi:hypothetical protein RA25_12320 [Leisingera sp. ANG-S5]|nr:hypothetical protein RA25_12320 [Leisingera sp. ANG-S5]